MNKEQGVAVAGEAGGRGGRCGGRLEVRGNGEQHVVVVAVVDEGGVAGDRPAVSDRLHAVHHHRQRHRHLDCPTRHRGLDNIYTISTKYLRNIYTRSMHYL